MTSGPTFEDIRAALEMRIVELCERLAPAEAYRANGGAYWFALNPTRADRRPGSFWIRLKPPIGVWCDHATGEGGDLFKLIQYIERLPDYAAVRAWSLAFLGWSKDMPKPTAAKIAADRRRAEALTQKRAALGEASLADNRRRALGLWLTGEPMGAEIPTLVRRYLAGRGIAIDRLPNALRFLPSHDYRLADGSRIARPCIPALMTGPDGKPWAVHRTWLEPDGSAKAVFPDPERNKPRKIWPAGWQGAVIRLSKGDSGVSPEEAGRTGEIGPLGIVEGWEDGLPIVIARPDFRVWAAGTLGNIGHVPMLGCIESAIVFADNDWNNPQAERSLADGLSRLRAPQFGMASRRVSVARSWRGKDVNDLHRGAA
ncbi:DUF7146 domain-containing protein [Jiella avicenniae]|uniref:Toprim domain-containing protein n=1 Tax=Jiella avicenniae TaxID=2907202 RepID=A0A9X1T2M5_9HYPH|nr:toprim domain-containing protein [Jiella avicenniae]MCE7026411.1 hypothetical protein [Jiella avicenniae]